MPKASLIHVISLECEGCISHNDTGYPSDPSNMIEENRAFLNELQYAQQSYDETITYIGSSAQSKPSDLISDDKDYSIPDTMLAISQDIGARFDPLLLADIYGDLPEGDSLSLENSEQPTADYSDRKYDTSKVSMIYAQIHKIAMEYPNHTIIFDFFDARNDICEHLFEYFQEHAELMPATVRLHLNLYAKNGCSCYPAIQGTGFIDSNYRQTVKDMVTISLEAAHVSKAAVNQNPRINVARLAKPDRLTNRIPAAPEYHVFVNQMKHLHEKATLLVQEGLEEAGKCARTLHKELLSHWGEYLNRKISAAEFKLFCGKDIHKARNVLEDHIGWKAILANIVAAVAGIGILYVAASTYHKVKYGSFLFFRTPTTHKLEDLEKAEENIPILPPE